MRKFFLVTVLSLYAIIALAYYPPIYILSAGYQGATIQFQDKEDTHQMKHGFRVGLGVDLGIASINFSEFSIISGLYYSTKGTNSNFLGVDLNLGYIEIPILLNTRFILTPRTHIIVNAGPYLAYGVYSGASLSPNEKSLMQQGDKIYSFRDAFRNDGFFRPFDAGVQVGGGIEYRRYQLNVGAQFGLVNILNPKVNLVQDDLRTTNKTFYVTLGYMF